MEEALKISIDVKKLDKSAFYEGKNGALYASLIIWPNRDGEDRFGNTGTVKQDLGKDRKGEQTAIIGNAKPLRKRQDAPAPQKTVAQSYEDADEVPF